MEIVSLASSPLIRLLICPVHEGVRMRSPVLAQREFSFPGATATPLPSADACSARCSASHRGTKRPLFPQA